MPTHMTTSLALPSVSARACIEVRRSATPRAIGLKQTIADHLTTRALTVANQVHASIPVITTQSAASMGPFLTRHRNVFIYVPNIVGYVRILLTLGALAFAHQHPEICVGAYFLAFVCDELDGRAARTFNQTSTLGAVLDMVTDRVATTGLLALLCTVYPAHSIVCIMLIALDIFSHWFQMYSTLLAGSSTHKDVKSRSWLVRTYYKNRIFMGFCCICCEVLYLALFLLHLPAYQQFAVLHIQLPDAVQRAAEGTPFEAAVSGWKGLPGVGLVALLALPGVFVKQLCNWVQLWTAMQGLVEYDVKKMA